MCDFVTSSHTDSDSDGSGSSECEVEQLMYSTLADFKNKHADIDTKAAVSEVMSGEGRHGASY